MKGSRAGRKRVFAWLVGLVLIAGLVTALTRNGEDFERLRARAGQSKRASGGPQSVANERGDAESSAKGRRKAMRSQRSETRRDLGQKIIARYRGSFPGESLLKAARKGRIGGVILFRDNLRSRSEASRAIAALQRAAADGQNPPLLVVIDQEGGDVKRIKDLPPRRSPAQIGRMEPADLTGLEEGLATARALRKLGINVNLAPVSDVASRSSPWLEERAYGRSPDLVARAACGFANGLMQGGVAPTLKHFPGLGQAGANTDNGRVVVTASRAQLRRDQLPYRQCAAQVPIVMVASATYSSSTSDDPAVLNPSIYRRDLPAVGFAGVTISDDLETPALAGYDRLERRAVRAGLDLLLYARNESAALTAYARLLGDARAKRLDLSQIQESAERIRVLKRRYARGPLRK